MHYDVPRGRPKRAAPFLTVSGSYFGRLRQVPVSIGIQGQVGLVHFVVSPLPSLSFVMFSLLL